MHFAYFPEERRKGTKEQIDEKKVSSRSTDKGWKGQTERGMTKRRNALNEGKQERRRETTNRNKERIKHTKEKKGENFYLD